MKPKGSEKPKKTGCQPTLSEVGEPAVGSQGKSVDRYHVALSFAGEDRKHVEAVASKLHAAGVRVFYDRFEETKLWGKDLYGYLSDIYQNRAFYTVIFISKAYAEKLWTNLERKAAQARAFSESREYLLPAVFDTKVEIPGVLKTTGYIDLNNLTPEEFAEKIIQKLQDEGVFLPVGQAATYAPEAKADVDYDLSGRRKIVEIIKGLKSHDWYVQRPAMEFIHDLDWAEVSRDEAFVLGRNIYQCACGNERTAVAFIMSLRRQLAKIPPGNAIDVLNGMFYEVYFDSKGEFREDDPKSERMNDLFAIQTIEKYRDSIEFVRRALSPYRESLVVLPNTTPEVVHVRVKFARKDPPLVWSIESLGQELLVDIPDDCHHVVDKMWRLSMKEFNLEKLRTSLAEAWYVPPGQLKIQIFPELPDDARLRLPKGKTIIRPKP